LQEVPFLALTVSLAAAAAGCSHPPLAAADLIVTHAAIWTGDASHPEAEALAVIGDRIVDVGSAAEIDRWRSPRTQVIDAQGRRILPGFNDAHVHFAAGGTQLASVDLRDAPSEAEFARRIIERARNRPGAWVTGGQWSERRWTPAELPTRHLIDDGTNGTPVFVRSADGRMALANAAALGRAGITERSRDPVGGTIVRDAAGLPTGLLTGTAMDGVARVIPRATDAERRETAIRALNHAASLGVTSVADMNPDPDDVSVYADLAARGLLTTRILAIPIQTAGFEQAPPGIRRGFESPWLRPGGVSGDATGAADQLRRLMAADRAGLQVCLNAGEGRTGVALALLASIVRANGERDRRFRIEHAETSTDSEADRFASMQAVASVQLAAGGADALKRFENRRVHTAIGSDWPSGSLDPMIGLARAASRVPIAVAVAAYTNGSAFAEYQETAKGTLARGMLADLVLLSDDILSMPADRVASVAVLTTIAGGQVVHQRRP